MPVVVPVGTCRAAALLLAALLLGGCADGGDERVTGHVSGDAALTDSILVEILADLHLADARRYLAVRDTLVENTSQDNTSQENTSQESIPREYASRDSLSPSQPDLFPRMTGDTAAVDSVLDVHGVTRAGYDRALDWYVDHPEQFVNLYNRVLDRLNQVR